MRSLRTPALPDLRPRIRAERRRESGAALLVSVLLLALMGVVGLASLDTVMRDRQVAGFSSNAQNALYAADAGISASLNLIRQEIVGAALSPGDCLTTPLANTALPNGSSYRPDATAPSNQICMLASAEPCSEIDASIEMGQPIYLYTVWSVRTEGIAPGGATARVHATAERCHAFNN
jgi:Tfp pilus assembly protein PilX